jgi:hypothetical protein
LTPPDPYRLLTGIFPNQRALLFQDALGGLTVDLAFRHFGQFLVGRLLLV